MSLLTSLHILSLISQSLLPRGKMTSPIGSGSPSLNLPFTGLPHLFAVVVLNSRLPGNQTALMTAYSPTGAMSSLPVVFTKIVLPSSASPVGILVSLRTPRRFSSSLAPLTYSFITITSGAPKVWICSTRVEMIPT